MAKQIKAYEKAVKYLEKFIAKNIAGTKLASERFLAEDCGVSRSTIREGIRVLEEKKKLIVHAGSGVYILGKEKRLKTLSQLEEDGTKLWEALELRRILEPQIAALATENMSTEQLEELKNIVKEHQNEIEQGKTGKEQDIAFHLKLVESTGNSILEELMQSLNNVLAETRGEFLEREQRRELCIVEHMGIIDALETGSAVLASAKMEEHIKTVEKEAFK